MGVFKREKDMTAIAKNLVAKFLYDKMQRRFQFVFFCQKDSDKEDSKLTSEIFGNDGDPEYFNELLSLLDDVVQCSEEDVILPAFRDAFKGFWDQFQNIKSGENDLRTLLNQFVKYLYVIVLILGGEQQLIEAEKKKKGLGYLIHNLHSEDYNPGVSDISDGLLINGEYVQLFDTLIRYRNGLAHPKANAGFVNGKDNCLILFPNQTYSLVPQDDKDTAAYRIHGLMLVCLLHLIDYNKAKVSNFISDNYHPVVEFNDIQNFNPDDFNRVYIDSLTARVKKELQRSVCYLNEQGNEDVHFIDLHLHPTTIDGQTVVEEFIENDNDTTSNSSRNPVAQDVSLRSIADAPSRVSVILGHPGAGKSTLLLYLLQTLCRRWSDANSIPVLPVYIECKNVSESKDRLEYAIRDSFRRYLPFSKDVESIVFHHLEQQFFRTGKAVFIIDGLNELKLSNSNPFLESVIDAIETKYPKAEYYITGRIHEYEKDAAFKFEELKSYIVYHMKELSFDKDIEPFLKESGVSDEQYS